MEQTCVSQSQAIQPPKKITFFKTGAVAQTKLNPTKVYLKDIINISLLNVQQLDRPFGLTQVQGILFSTASRKPNPTAVHTPASFRSKEAQNFLALTLFFLISHWCLTGFNLIILYNSCKKTDIYHDDVRSHQFFAKTKAYYQYKI